MKIALTTLGCKLNYAETSTYERGFLAHGLEVVPWNTPADVYLINTCAVTETAEKKSRNLMRRAHKTAPLAPVIVTGCYAELKKEKLLEIEGVARVFGAREKNRVVPETLALLEGKTAEAPSEEILPAYSSGERTRSFLRTEPEHPDLRGRHASPADRRQRNPGNRADRGQYGRFRPQFR